MCITVTAVLDTLLLAALIVVVLVVPVWPFTPTCFWWDCTPAWTTGNVAVYIGLGLKVLLLLLAWFTILVPGMPTFIIILVALTGVIIMFYYSLLTLLVIFDAIFRCWLNLLTPPDWCATSTFNTVFMPVAMVVVAVLNVVLVVWMFYGYLVYGRRSRQSRRGFEPLAPAATTPTQSTLVPTPVLGGVGGKGFRFRGELPK